jgi:hypothetical protein
LKLAGSHAIVEWHSSHCAAVITCPGGFPVEVTPLWQVVHVPGVTLVWSKTAGSQAVVL